MKTPVLTEQEKIYLNELRSLLTSAELGEPTQDEIERFKAISKINKEEETS
jgi:hypothetical protein